MSALASYFTRSNPRKVWCLKSRKPQWLQDAIYAAHDGALPNDWVYDECRAACDAIDDGSLASQDDIQPFADGRVDVYCHDLARWYANEQGTGFFAAAEDEARDLGLGDEGGDINQRLTIIQCCAIARIARIILDAAADNVGGT